MSHSHRLFRTALLTALALLGGCTASANAERAETVNACLYDFNGTWGDVPLWLDGTPSADGRTAKLSGVTAGARLPQWLPDTLASFLGNGTHRLSVDVWAAVAGENSMEGTQVRHTTGTATTVVTNRGATPLDVALQPLDDLTWSGTPSADTITVRQAGPTALGTVPAGPSNSDLNARGSVLIRAVYRPLNLRFILDCQPGTTPNGDVTNSNVFTPGASQPLARIGLGPTPFTAIATPTPAPGEPATPTPAPAPATPTNAARSGPSLAGNTVLRFGSRAVVLRVSCASEGSGCSGAVRLTSVSRLRLTKRGAPRRRVVATGVYAVPAGATALLKVALTRDGRALRKKVRRVDAALHQSSGAGPVSARLRVAR